MPQKTNWLVILLIGVVIVGIIGPAKVWDTIMGVEEAPEDKDKPKEIVEFCSDPSVTMKIGPMQKMYAPTTSVSTEYARVFVEGIDEGLKVDSATMGVSWEDDIEIFYAAESAGYYAAKTAFEVPCKSTILSAKYDGNAHKLYENDTSTNLNFKFWNEDDGLLNAGGTQEEIAVGDIVSISGVIRGNYEDAFSPYGGMYVTIKSYSTYYDEIDFKVDTTGFSVSDATTPTVRSNAASETGYTLKTYKVNKGLISNEYMDFTLTIDADDSTEPTQTWGNVTIYFDDEDWYRNTDTGIMEFGPEDNDDADVGIVVKTAILYVS